MGIYQYEFKIEFGDIGENNTLTTKAYLRFMQEAAGLASAEVGYGLNDIPKTHVTWLLLNWKLQLESSLYRPCWGNKICVKTWPRQTNKLYSYRDFEMYDANHQLLAIATSKWVLINTDAHHITKITDQMIQEYDCLDQEVFPEKMQEKLKEPKDYDSIYTYTIQRRDIDTNHHVNNLCYLDFAYESFPEEIYLSMQQQLKQVEIMYKKEALLGEEIVCLFKKENTTDYTVTVKNKKTQELHSILRFHIV